MTVFDVFKAVPYSYLVIAQGTVRGDAVVSERQLEGIFKDKAGEVQNGNMESVSSTSTLHVYPSDFPNTDCSSLIGNGIRYNGVEYTITGATAGMNYETGNLEHYRLTLQKAKFTAMAPIEVDDYLETESGSMILTELGAVINA